MAKKGDPHTGRAIANSASSQYFINVVNNSNEIFDEDYPVFGDVIEGIEVADIISEVTPTGVFHGPKTPANLTTTKSRPKIQKK